MAFTFSPLESGATNEEQFTGESERPYLSVEAVFCFLTTWRSSEGEFCFEFMKTGASKLLSKFMKAAAEGWREEGVDERSVLLKQSRRKRRVVE